MEETLGNIYSWFDSLYGKPLSEYLWGYNCETQEYSDAIIYNQVGLIAIAFALCVPPIYYYLWNPVRRQQLKFWSLLVTTSIINLMIAYLMVSSDYDNGLIGDCLKYTPTGTQIIDETNIIMFGVVNAMFTAGIYFLFSILIYKWGSKTVKHYPF